MRSRVLGELAVRMTMAWSVPVITMNSEISCSALKRPTYWLSGMLGDE